MARTRPWGFFLTLGAFAWSALLLVAAVTVPVYSSASSSGAAPPASDSTLVAVNGWPVLGVVAILLALTAIAWYALHAKCARGSTAGGAVAIAVTGVTCLFGLVSILSIGMFVLPVAGLLAAAVAATPSGMSRSAESG